MPRSPFDPQTQANMDRALDAAWSEFMSRSPIWAEPEKSGIRRALALRIVAAAKAGQRDPERLLQVALHVVDGCLIRRADESSLELKAKTSA